MQEERLSSEDFSALCKWADSYFINASIIPRNIKKLESLKKLDFTNNKIKYIPKELAKLNNLAFLRILSYRLESISDDFLNLESLKFFEFLVKNPEELLLTFFKTSDKKSKNLDFRLERKSMDILDIKIMTKKSDEIFIKKDSLDLSSIIKELRAREIKEKLLKMINPKNLKRVLLHFDISPSNSLFLLNCAILELKNTLSPSVKIVFSCKASQEISNDSIKIFLVAGY